MLFDLSKALGYADLRNYALSLSPSNLDHASLVTLHGNLANKLYSGMDSLGNVQEWKVNIPNISVAADSIRDYLGNLTRGNDVTIPVEVKPCNLAVCVYRAVCTFLMHHCRARVWPSNILF